MLIREYFVCEIPEKLADCHKCPELLQTIHLYSIVCDAYSMDRIKRNETFFGNSTPINFQNTNRAIFAYAN